MTTADPGHESSQARLDDIVHACAAVAIEAADRTDIPDIARVAEAFAEALPDTVESHCPDRVHELVADAQSFAPAGPAGRLTDAIAAGVRDLDWWTAYGDHTEPDIVELLRSYFVASIISLPGPRQSPRRHDEIAVYLTIQGPGLMYPQHVHKAPELYYPIAGTGLWQTGDRPFAPKAPGTWIVHPTGTRHAMESRDEPMLSMAIWTADLGSVPVIVRD